MPVPEGLLTTAQVCRELGITPNRVQRLTREGYLEISAVKTLKYGEEYLYKSAQVSILRQQMPRILSKWATEENMRLGARKAGLNRAVEAVNAVEVRKRSSLFLTSLEHLSEETAGLLKCSYYLFHLNHYAKSGHPYLYELKEKILRHLVKRYIDTPYLQVILVQGQQKVDLCQACRTRANKLNVSYGEYAKSYGGCPRCKKQSSYYDLFEFNIQYEDHRFSFHTPYSVGRKWFDRGKELPRQYRGHRQEQGLTFGRPVTEREALALPMDEIIDKLEKILDKFS
ncbi:MAG: hypothetical protein JL50_18500 [Peptococcaceae bacterium BICA1-7]|nr:MAG: hypothetical protein JL50_18500 [Peptococcaceae bacterium BICA1-7]HBV99075.1 hypothetical protein [Desulfotomaculum sp.]